MNKAGNSRDAVLAKIAYRLNLELEENVGFSYSDSALMKCGVIIMRKVKQRIPQIVTATANAAKYRKQIDISKRLSCPNRQKTEYWDTIAKRLVAGTTYLIFNNQ